MKRLIVNLILIIIMIFSVGRAIYNYEYLSKKSNVVNVYLNDSKYTSEYFDNIKKDEDSYSFVPWRQADNKQIFNEDLNRSLEANIFQLYGDSSFLLDGNILFRDDINGCLIDEDTAYGLFGSIDVKGRSILVDNREVEVRGVNNKYENTIFIQGISNSKEQVEGISLWIPSKGDVFNSKDFVTTFIMKYDLNNCTVDSNIYNTIASVFMMILFILIVISMINYIIKYKPIMALSYMVVGLILTLITKLILKIRFIIPINSIPSNWSDYKQFREVYISAVENFKYFLYVKKYSIDIDRLNSTINVSMYIILTIILFFIVTKRLRKVSRKELNLLDDLK